MELDEMKELLNGCTRSENRDHAFGDVEVSWYDGDTEVASGHFGGSEASVMIGNIPVLGTTARELRYCGIEGHIERNDTTGPDEFIEGKIMPGLTLEGVREELITPPTESGD